MDTIEKIVRLAERRGMTQQSLEDEAGLPAGRVAKWKAGQGEPTASQAWRIAKVLGVDVAALLDDGRDV